MRVWKRLLAVVLALGSVAAIGPAPATAQDGKSIWQVVEEQGILRVGVAEGPPLVMRDPRTGTWAGYVLGAMNGFGAVLGVEGEPVATTWGKQGVAFAFRKNVPIEDVQVLDIDLEEQIATGAVQRLYAAAVNLENKQVFKRLARALGGDPSRCSARSL